MLYLGYVLLRYVLIYNLEVSFNFHLTFLQLLWKSQNREHQKYLWNVIVLRGNSQ